MDPIQHDIEYYEDTWEVSQDWNGLGTIDSILTGPRYYHIFTIRLNDSFSSSFGFDEEYKLRVDFDLDNTIFDPDPVEFAIEDGGTAEFPIRFYSDENDIIYFGYAFLVVTDIDTNITIQTQVTTYYMPISPEISIGELPYIIQTTPIETNYTTQGSFTWHPLPNNYFFVDPAIIPSNEPVEVSVTIHMRYLTSTDDSDRLRVSLGDESHSIEIQTQSSVGFTLDLTTIYIIEIDALSDFLQFSIPRIDIHLPTTLFSDGDGGVTIPKQGWIMSLILFSISITITIKEGDTILEIKKEEKK